MISTNEVYVDQNTELILTHKVYELDERLLTLESEDPLRGLNTSTTLDLSNGTFSATYENESLATNKVYLVSIKYTKSNGLVDQSLYTLQYRPGVRLQPTYNLVKCYNGNDNFLVTLSGTTLTLATQYTGSDTPTAATVRFV